MDDSADVYADINAGLLHPTLSMGWSNRRSGARARRLSIKTHYEGLDIAKATESTISAFHCQLLLFRKLIVPCIKDAKKMNPQLVEGSIFIIATGLCGPDGEIPSRKRNLLRQRMQALPL